MQVPSTDCLQTPNELFWEKSILHSPQRFKDCYDAEKDPDKKVALQKWHISHLILASDYTPLNREVKVLQELGKSAQLSKASKGDIKYCEALKNYYLGYFQATIDVFFPKGKENLFEHHAEDGYQMAHDHFLLGKAYLKMSYFTRAYFHFYQAIHHFAEEDSKSIWIPKVFGLIAKAYFQEEKFKEGERFINLAMSKLEKDLGERHTDHHVYGSLCMDLGDGYLAKGKNASEASVRSKDYHEADHWLGEGEEIFDKIYQGKGNRYNALIFQKLGVLDKRRATAAASNEDAQVRYQDAMENLSKDLAIRKELFKDSDPESNIPHHTTLGDTCNIIAKLKIQQANRTKGKKTKQTFLLESIHHANMSMHYLVKGYFYKNIDKTTHDLGILQLGITPELLNGPEKLKHVQSYFYLLQAFHLKLKALKRLLKITPRHQHQVIKTDFYSIIAMCSTFISKVRKEYENDLANFALDKITRPLFESILSFLYLEYDAQKNKGAIEDDLLKIILETLESSKNYDIVQAIEKDEIHIEQGDQLIRDLSNKFQKCIQEDGSFSREEKAIAFLKKRHKKISQLCQDLRKQDDKASEVHHSIGPKVNIADVKNKMKELAVHINEGRNDKDTAIISFFYGKREIFAFTINAEDCGFFKLKIKPKQLQQQIEQLVSIMNEENFKKYLKDYNTWLLNNNLYEKLIGDLKIPDNIRFLIFLPDHKLNQLPFDIIPQKVSQKDIFKNKIKYLVQKYHTSYHYSISMLYQSVESALDATHTASQWTTNYLGISSNHTQKPPEEQKASSNGDHTNTKTDLIMEVTNTGLQMIKAGIAKESVQCYVDQLNPPYPDDLNVADLSQIEAINKNLCHTQILHFATHATSDMTLIRLNEDYTIGLKEIKKTENVGLVILHGCNTGRNESPDKSFASKSLGRLFLAKKGIRNVIYSVTSVINSLYEALGEESDPSIDLIEKFFALLLESINQEKKITYPVALSKVKAEILSKEEYNFFPPLVAGLIFVGCPTDFFAIEVNKKNS